MRIYTGYEEQGELELLTLLSSKSHNSIEKNMNLTLHCLAAQ